MNALIKGDSRSGKIVPGIALLIVLIFGFAVNQSTAQSDKNQSALTPIDGIGSPHNDSRPAANEQSTVTSQTSKSKAKYDISRIGDRGIGHGLDFYSIEQERQLGQELAGMVE